MTGKETRSWGFEHILAGLTSSDNASDGGLAPSSYHINPFVDPGLIYSMPNGTNLSTNATGNMIASDSDSQSVAGYDRLFVDDEGAYYTLANTTLTKQNTGSQTAKYIYPRTDMVSFAQNTYVTLTDDIAQWNTSGTPALDEDWWSVTKGQGTLGNTAPHPLLVFEGYMWVADANVLHRVNASLTVETSVLTLNSSERIIALGIDPGTGMMMISTTTAFDLGNEKSSQYHVYLYDGYSSKPRRKIAVDNLITAFQPVGGRVYVGMGRTVGEWNGSGVTFMRKLRNTSYVFYDLSYKQRFSSWRGVLLVVDGNEVLAYGEVVAGKKAWYPILKNRTEDTGSTADYNIIANVGSDRICVSMYSGDKLYRYAMMTASSGNGYLVGAKLEFDRPVFLRRIRIIHTAITTTGGIGTVGIILDTGLESTPSVSTLGAVGTTTYYKDFEFGGLKTNVIQPFVEFDSQVFGVERIIAFFDVAE